MRYIVIGAGAIGCVLGGRLHESGRDVVFVARGTNLAALKSDGLRLVCSDGDVVVRVDAVGDVSDIVVRDDDIVILAMKSDDAAAAIENLRREVPPDASILCTQNGVATERLALRHFRLVYSAFNYLVATHLLPATVGIHTSPSSGVIDVGRYPLGIDETVELLADELRLATFDSIARPDVMRWKYSKLLQTLAGAFQAICTNLADLDDLVELARAEGASCYQAARIDFVDPAEQTARLAHLYPLSPVSGHEFIGGSSWQSLARRTGRIETDYLNGEVSLLGRLTGVATPVNDGIRTLITRCARKNMAPGTMPPDEVRRELDALRC